MLCNNGDDVFRCDHFFLIRRNNILQCLLCQLQSYFLFFKLGSGHDRVEGTFQLTDIGFDIGSDIFDNIFTDAVAVHFFIFMKDRHSGFVVRQRDICDQTPLEPGTEALFQDFHILWWFIRGYDDLLFGTVKTIKCMEKFLLCGFFSYNKLNIIDEKNVDISVFFTEFTHCRVISVSDGFDQLVGKFLTGYIQNTAVFVVFQNEMSDGMHKMRLTKTGSAIDKQWIVGISR